MTEDIILHSGAKLTNIHPEGTCLLEFCAIHNPSDHPLRDAPMEWFGGPLNALMRVCKHDVWHPDPDALRYKTAVGDWATVEAITSVHLMKENCDGCCHI